MKKSALANPMVINRQIASLKELKADTDKILKNAKSDEKILKKLSSDLKQKISSYQKKFNTVSSNWKDLERKIELSHSFKKKGVKLEKRDYKQIESLRDFSSDSQSIGKKNNIQMNKKDILSKYKINAQDITQAKKKKKKIEKLDTSLKPKQSSKKIDIKKGVNSPPKKVTKPSPISQNKKDFTKTKPLPKPKKPKGPKI